MNHKPENEARQMSRLKYLLLITPFAYALSEATRAAPAMQVGAMAFFFIAAELLIRRKHTLPSEEVSPAT